MSLTPGTRIGPYEVAGPIGAGGMGEVYQARDTKIGRDVALKVMPALFMDDPDRLARFEREAQALGALNHPNIAQVFGFEHSGDVRAIAMELVEGPTLEEMIGAGAIGFADALPIVRQIAGALAAAHDRGIVHRDLKPANVKVRDDGTVKVLDFGLAKAMDTDEASGGNVSNSPTLTARATQLGMILGTAAYMSPEQAKARPVDRRADIWAFGVVLFEMLAGRRAFDGDDISDVMASVLKMEPDWTALPADVPPAAVALLRRCLEKDPKKRLRDIGEGMYQLDQGLATAATSAGGRTPTAAPPATASWWGRLVPVGTLALGLAAGWLVWSGVFSTVEAPDVMRFNYIPEAGALMTSDGSVHHLDISSDGRMLVYRAIDERGIPHLRVRRFDQLEGVALRGGEGGTAPFLSPDGLWVGFLDYRSLNVIRKVSVFGGPPQTVVTASGAISGASWDADGTIVFAVRSDGLFEVPDGGGEARRLTDLSGDGSMPATDQVWPSVVAGTPYVLFTRANGAPLTSGQIAVLNRETGAITQLEQPGSSARYVSTGHIVFAAADASLQAVPFDLDRMAITGNPVPVVQGVDVDLSGAADFAMSANGRLAYVPGSVSSTMRSVVWVDRSGSETPITTDPRGYTYARVSPDGTRLSLDIRDDNQDIWVWDLARETLSRLTFSAAQDNYAEWLPDSTRVVVSSRADMGSNSNLHVYRADGTGTGERLTDAPGLHIPNAVSPDGRFVIFRGPVPGRGEDLFTVSLEADHAVTTLLSTEHTETNAAISPNGRWIAYQATPSGGEEIFVRAFPDAESGGQWQLSQSGGVKPMWSRDGREVFYVGADGQFMVVPVESDDAFVAGRPAPLFDASGYYFGSPGRNYDISPDGKRFVMIKPLAFETSSSPITIVVNWFEDLKKIR